MKPIRTPEDHAALLAEIASLMGAEPGSAEADRLEILAVLASEYERRDLPPESDPVDLLSLMMRGRGLSQAELSDVLGSRARASEVLSRRRNLSAEMVERVAGAWAIPRRLLAGSPIAMPRRRQVGKALAVLAGAIAFLATAAASPFLLYGWNLPDVAPLVAEAARAPHPEALPPHLAQAFIAAEDRNFLSHDGYDAGAILRAAGITLGRGFEQPQGGATLTQQLAKNSLLADEGKSVRRKVREILLARRIEAALSKDEILGLYLSRVYFGGGAYGIDAAARHYFGRAPAELSVSQAAYLASLVKAPSARSLDRPENRRRSLAARQEVVARMARAGFITPDTAKAALREPLRSEAGPIA
jgi:penicillin-binding protein 1A